MSRPATERRFYFDGAKLRAIRRGRRFSLEALARGLDRAGVELMADTIRRWEIGASEPRAAQLYTVARILEIPPHQLMLDGVPPEKPPAERR